MAGDIGGGAWRWIGARAAGSSHRRMGTPCQDAFACEVLAGGGIVAAVADGAGSAENSERGAEIVVRATVAEVIRALDSVDPAKGGIDFEGVLQDAVAAAREAVIGEAVEQGAEPRSYASTLLALVLTEQGGAAAQIGDGVILVRASPDLTGAGHEWVYVTWPQHGEYVNTTYFLTADDAAERLVVVPLDAPVNAFALTTDGLERLVLHFDAQTVHAPFFDGMLRPLLAAASPEAVARLSPALAAFLASERVASRTDDDVTLVLAAVAAAGARDVIPTGEADAPP